MLDGNISVLIARLPEEGRMVANVAPTGTDLPISRCELDSHANMVVIGTEAFYFESGGRVCDVSPYDKSRVRTLPIKDAALAYDCPYTGSTTILIFRNTICVPEIKYNLIPPFILREAGITVNEQAKIHCKDPSEDDHAISFKDLSSDLRIPMSLNGVFSYFKTRKPTILELNECDKIICTPDSVNWNPNCPSFAKNEASMVDWEGNLAPENRWLKDPMIFEQDTDESFYECHTVNVDQVERVMTANVSSMNMQDMLEDSCPFSSVSHDDHGFASALNEKVNVSSFDCTKVDLGKDLGQGCDPFEDNMIGSLDALRGMVEEYVKSDKLDKIDTMIAAVAGGQSGVSAHSLSKLWMISEAQAQGAIDFNTQLCRQSADNTLSRDFSTNDRMLRYRRINSVFFTDTLVATSCPSIRGHKYAQIFVSDKGYVAVYPMKSQSEFEDALHWFCKEVGVPVDLVMDGHKSISENLKVKRFAHQVGLTLKVLERNTPWANRAELYIRLLKEAVRKDLRATDAPMRLWDYALERRALIHNLVPRPLFQNDRPPHEATFGAPGDISRLCNYGFYEFVYYRDHGSFPANKEKLGKVLGPAKNEGNEMAQYVLNAKGVVVIRRSLRKLTIAETASSVEAKKQELFGDII